MTSLSRIAIVGALVLLVGFPLGSLFWHHLSWASLASADTASLGPQLASTLSLMGLVVVLAVPAGTLQAFAIRRGGVRGRRWLGAAVLAGLFVPLPVWAVSWQIILGEWLPPLALEPGDVAWRPWKVGLLPAAWIHAVAAWPWAIAIVWLALQTSNPALEDEASQTGGPRGVFRWVLLPRLAWALLAAAALIALQAGTEIAITDAMMVRTFAEEVYTQMVIRSGGLGGAITATVPIWLGSALLLSLVARLGMQRFRTAPADIRIMPAEPTNYSFGRTLLAWSPVLAYLGLPVGALLWKVASGGEFAGRMEKLLRTEWLTLLDSLAAAALAGAFTALLAWVACALALRSPRLRAFLLAGGMLLAAIPGPLVGFAIKEATVELVLAERSVLRLLDLDPEFPPLRSLLYDQPSPVPGIWAATLRFLPLASALMAVALLRIPRSLVELAVAEGRHPFGVWRRAIAPLTARAYLIVAIATSALAFGEVSAGKLAQPPARGVSVLRLFDQMHYGAESTVAGFCLLQLAATWGILWVLVGLNRNGLRESSR